MWETICISEHTVRMGCLPSHSETVHQCHDFMNYTGNVVHEGNYYKNVLWAFMCIKMVEIWKLFHQWFPSVNIYWLIVFQDFTVLSAFIYRKMAEIWKLFHQWFSNANIYWLIVFQDFTLRAVIQQRMELFATTDLNKRWSIMFHQRIIFMKTN